MWKGVFNFYNFQTFSLLLSVKYNDYAEERSQLEKYSGDQLLVVPY